MEFLETTIDSAFLLKSHQKNYFQNNKSYINDDYHEMIAMATIMVMMLRIMVIRITTIAKVMIMKLMMIKVIMMFMMITIFIRY